jgi:hypothetical protein
MKVVALFAALIAVSATQMDGHYNPASSGQAAATGAHLHIVATDTTMIPKCFPHCGDGY